MCELRAAVELMSAAAPLQNRPALSVAVVIPTLNEADSIAAVVNDDVITQIDGRRLTDDSLNSVFTKPVGTPLRLTVRHSGSVRIVSLALREVL